METSAEEFIALLIQSRLLDAESAQEALRQWRAAAGVDADDATQWRSWLVEQKLITAYQASLLGRGHTEGYFLRNYKILDRIGRGRMAGVYRAIDEIGNQVAIKVLPPSKAKDPILLARFQREARLVERLAHVNVMRAREVGEVDGFNYLVMDHLDGETLDAVLQRRVKLSVEESVDLLEQALSGLQHIHEQGLVHRDLKPGNIMLVPRPGPSEPDVTTGCILKILDFGLSRVANDDQTPEPVQELQLTAAGAMLGTSDYIAPEQARDARAADIRADIYSLGCVAYHLLAGRPPFPDKNAIRQMVRHATETPPSLEQTRPDAPAFLQKLLDRMLAKDPADRFTTPAEALHDLRAPSRATESFEAVQTLRIPPAVPSPMFAIGEPDSAVFDFKGADAPTTKQDVFTPLPAEAVTKTLTTANTPPENIHLPDRKSADNLGRADGRAGRPPSNETRTTAPIRTKGRATQERPRIDVELVAEAPIEPAPSSWRFSRRDAVMFVAGATTVLLALSLGALFSWITRGK